MQSLHCRWWWSSWNWNNRGALFLFLLFSLFLVLQSLHCHRHCAQKQRSFHWKQMLWRSLSHILLPTQCQCFSLMKALYELCKMLTRRRSLSSQTCSHPLNVSLSWKLFPALEKQMFRRRLSRVALSHLLHSHIFPSFKTIISLHRTWVTFELVLCVPFSLNFDPECFTRS